MWDTILKIVLALLMVIGAVDLARLFFRWLLGGRTNGKLFLVLHLSGHDDSMEAVLRDGLERLQQSCPAEEKFLVCVDYGLDEETRKICELMARENPMLLFATPWELGRILEQ